jgi:hypothetical protein
LRIPLFFTVLQFGTRAFVQFVQRHEPYKKFANSEYSSMFRCIQSMHRKRMLSQPENVWGMVTGMVSGDPRRVSGSHGGIATIHRGHRSQGKFSRGIFSHTDDSSFWPHSLQIKTTRFILENIINTIWGRDGDIQPWQRSHRMVLNPSAPRLQPGLLVAHVCSIMTIKE